MTVSHLAVPSALRQLEEQIGRGQHADALFQALRAVQNTGLSKDDIVVRLERMRVKNELTEDSETVDENLLLLLDMTRGLASTHSLSWDAGEIARIYLPRVVDHTLLSDSFRNALAPSDMLPAASVEPNDDLRSRLVAIETNNLLAFEHRPQMATVIRVPKTGFATRPAAVVAPADRMVYEALAYCLQDVLSQNLDERVLWPRSADPAASEYGRFVETPSTWSSEYVVVVDVDGFYESVNHSLLTVFLREYFGQERSFLLAVEGTLGAVMGKPFGLPQGPRASDAFASAFLAPLDAFISQSGWEFARYQDDLIVGAQSILDGRRKLEQIERALSEIGLRVNSSKTSVIRVSTYADNALGGSNKRLRRFADSVGDRVRTHLERSEGDDSDEIAEMLAEIGVADDSLWQLLYHHSMSVDDIVDEVHHVLTPQSIELYGKYVQNISMTLKQGLRPDGGSMSEVESDLRECLAALASAKSVDFIDEVEQIQQWFAGLAPFVATYLAECAVVKPNRIRQFLRRWALEGAETDWVSASLCSVLEKTPSLIDAQFAALLRTVALDQSSGVMTRLVVARSLARSQQLDSDTQRRVLVQIPAALRLELLLYVAELDGGETDELLRAISDRG